MLKLRLTLIIAIIMATVLIGGYRLSQAEPETVSAASAPSAAAPLKLESITNQVTTLAEVENRNELAGGRTSLFRNLQTGYHVSYPARWEWLALSDTLTLFQSPDGMSRVKVEAAGPLPADGLGPFVDRSLGQAVVYSRQLLTVYGQEAERVVTFADDGSLMTTFYINANDTVFVITGVGDQAAVEFIARSFNAPQEIALR